MKKFIRNLLIILASLAAISYIVYLGIQHRKSIKEYSYTDHDGNNYILKFYSEKQDDWEIWVYEDDKITFVEKFDHHELLEKLPNQLLTRVQLDIGRGQKNIAADKAAKSS